MFARTLLSRVFRIHTKSRKQNGGSSSERLLALVYDELIIYEMSVVMKIGHLPEATQFTVTEVFTFLITPSSSRLHTLLAKGQRAESRPDKMTCLWRLLLLHFTCADIVAWWQECTWMSREVQTDKILETHGMHNTHTCVKGEPGACDVATEVINTHSFPCWQNVKIDSGAGRWKGQWACFERV